MEGQKNRKWGLQDIRAQCGSTCLHGYESIVGYTRFVSIMAPRMAGIGRPGAGLKARSTMGSGFEGRCLPSNMALSTRPDMKVQRSRRMSACSGLTSTRKCWDRFARLHFARGLGGLGSRSGELELESPTFSTSARSAAEAMGTLS